MNKMFLTIVRAGERFRNTAALLTLLAAPLLLPAQTPLIVGYPANFDTYNNTGSPVYGFEMEVDGIQPGDVTRVFPSNFPVAPGQPCVIRYCVGTVTPFTGGVYIRWAGVYDANTQQWSLSTPPANGTVATGESCWTLGLGARYDTAGCEHFGITTTRQWTNIVYHWLVPDPNNPSQLVYYSGNTVPLPGMPPPPPIPVILPQPVVNVIPPAQPGGAPAVAFEVQAPRPPQQLAQYGEAQWVKVYKLEQQNEVDLNDLMGGNPAVPENAAQVEVGWKLLQYDPTPHGNKGIIHNQANLGNGNHAVVRRYEHYKYTGTYDAATHEALCLDGTCSAPGPGELGDMVGAQNAAVNLELPSLAVVKAGSGTVSGAGGAINCGGTCFANLPGGASESLTAQAPSNGVFNGWSGACTGQQSTCGLTIAGAMSVTATFTTVHTLSVSRSGNGSISGTPNGEFSTLINCGGSCSAKFQDGKVVTLTATPAAGVTFTGWSGACSGTNPVCNVTVTGDTKAQANFK